MIKIDVSRLPKTSDSLTTKDHAIKAIAQYGQPTRIVWKYRTHAIVALGAKYLYIPNDCLTIS